ncbi:MAG: GNAT family N-acetyltransferase [Thermoplasmata archaeon]|nr:GNAT family N-acetyltransferase [Thermoplasmata archaeon]TFG68265.1 MAG: GNAT family N-acetyltransferase [Methanomassiliicoccus sp.]
MAAAASGNPEFKRIDDFDAVKELALRAGLDVADKPVNDIVAAFGYFIDGRLMGAAALEFEDGNHFLEWVAVDGSVRLRGIGASLVAMIEDEAMSRGMTELWAKARIPNFYRRIGYRVLSKGERGPKTLDGCLGCSELNKTCHPAIIMKDLRPQRRIVS